MLKTTSAGRPQTHYSTIQNTTSEWSGVCVCVDLLNEAHNRAIWPCHPTYHSRPLCTFNMPTSYQLWVWEKRGAY